MYLCQRCLHIDNVIHFKFQLANVSVSTVKRWFKIQKNDDLARRKAGLVVWETSTYSLLLYFGRCQSKKKSKSSGLPDPTFNINPCSIKDITRGTATSIMILLNVLYTLDCSGSHRTEYLILYLFSSFDSWTENRSTFFYAVACCPFHQTLVHTRWAFACGIRISSSFPPSLFLFFYSFLFLSPQTWPLSQ